MKKTLVLLDLDHTLIYGSYAPTEEANKLFQFNQFLSVYERPLAKELIELCKNIGDIIIYTTALKTYATKISKSLMIEPIQILSRKNCIKIKEQYRKQIDPIWFESYETIIVIDDSPNVWINTNDSIHFLVPTEFRGTADDMNLLEVIDKLNVLKH
jgi:TFIIF-interacting CTD phosphatase-like protein